jgi:hypothetical protein
MLDFGQPTNLTATAALSTKPARLVGFYVNSTTAGTIVLRDGGASGTVVSGTITPAVGWHFFPASFSISAHATIGGTLDVTFITIPG